jgi:hypothetical protein
MMPQFKKPALWQGFFVEIGRGEIIPFGYCMVWNDFIVDRGVFSPFGLHWVFRAAHQIYMMNQFKNFGDYRWGDRQTMNLLLDTLQAARDFARFEDFIPTADRRKLARELEERFGKLPGRLFDQSYREERP